MIKNTVINAELGYALATARHKDAIVICDANMPIPEAEYNTIVQQLPKSPVRTTTLAFCIVSVKRSWLMVPPGSCGSSD